MGPVWGKCLGWIAEMTVVRDAIPPNFRDSCRTKLRLCKMPEEVTPLAQVLRLTQLLKALMEEEKEYTRINERLE